MKSLQNILNEGLFDNDVIDKDVEFGSFYELSDVSHDNMVSNDLSQILRCFDKKKLKQNASKTQFPTSERKNGFVNYWGTYDNTLPDFINTILGMPAYLIMTDEKTNNRSILRCKEAEKLTKSYLDKLSARKFIKLSGRPRDWDIIILKEPTKHSYIIEFIEGIFDSRPNRMKLTFIEK